MIATLRPTVDHFFIGQHSSQCGTPIHGYFGLVRQALRVAVRAYRILPLCRDLGRNGQAGNGQTFACYRVVPSVVEKQENELGPAVVGWIRGIDLTVPVVTEAQHLDLTAEIRDVFFRRLTRMSTRFDSVLLGRQSKGIPPHGVQHAVATHALVASQNIGGGVAFGVPHMKACTRWVGEHVKYVILGLGRIPLHLKRLIANPEMLPAGLDGGGMVTRHGGPVRSKG